MGKTALRGCGARGTYKGIAISCPLSPISCLAYYLLHKSLFTLLPVSWRISSESGGIANYNFG
jgi:hypothetical protein